MASSGGDVPGKTLMDLITSDPTPIPSSSSSAPFNSKTASASATSVNRSDVSSNPTGPSSTLGKPGTNTERKSKKATLIQFQNDTISAAKALNPVRTSNRQKKKKPISYPQLARSIHELAATSDQKSSQKQLVNIVFPKLAVYNSVDPSLAPSLLMLLQQCEDRNVLRYVYYYLARILPETGAQGLTSGGGIPTPNWEALANIDATGGVTRADVVPRVVAQLTSEASNADAECIIFCFNT